MMNAQTRSSSLLDWRIVLGVLLFHILVFWGSRIPFDFFKTERPIEIAIEVSDMGSVVGSQQAPQQQRLQAGEKVPTKDKKVVETNQPKASADDGLVKQAPTASAQAGAGGRDSQTTAASSYGGAQGAPQARPDVSAKPLKNPKPIYPKKAYDDRLEGTVTLLVEVLESGKTGQVQLAISSGVPSLDESAIEAVKVWQFSPAKAGGQIVKQWVRIPIKFNLSREGR